MTAKATVEIRFLVTPEQAAALQAAALQYGWSQSELIRIALCDFFLHSTKLKLFPAPNLKRGRPKANS